MAGETLMLGETEYEVLTLDELVRRIDRAEPLSPLRYPIPCLPLVLEQTWISGYPESPKD